MKCKKIERLLNVYLDNELPEQIKPAIQGHLSGCEKCTHTLNEIVKLKELIGTTTPYPVNPFLWTRIAESLKEEALIPIGVLITKILRVWVPIATMLILLSAVILYRLPELKIPAYKGTLATILDMPIVPENMEKITLNLLVYSNGLARREVPYAKF